MKEEARFSRELGDAACGQRADNSDIKHICIFMANLESRMGVLRGDVNCSISSCDMLYLTGEIIALRVLCSSSYFTCQLVCTKIREVHSDLMLYSESVIKTRTKTQEYSDLDYT